MAQHAYPLRRLAPQTYELEAAFQAKVEQTAGLMGWLCYHTHDARRSNKGFPDLVMVRERVVFAELKASRGKLSADQVIWLDSLHRAGAEAYVWRPSDWEDIVHILRRGGTRGTVGVPSTHEENQ